KHGLELLHPVGAGLVPDLVSGHPYLEDARLRPFAGDQVDVDRGTGADRGEEQLNRCEAVPVAGPDLDDAAMGVACPVAPGAGALDVDDADRLIAHGIKLPPTPWNDAEPPLSTWAAL